MQRGHSRLRDGSTVMRSSRRMSSRYSPAVSLSSSTFCSSKASNQIPPQPPWQASTTRLPTCSSLSSLKQAGHLIDWHSQQLGRTPAAILQPLFGWRLAPRANLASSTSVVAASLWSAPPSCALPQGAGPHFHDGLRPYLSPLAGTRRPRGRSRSPMGSGGTSASQRGHRY